MLRQLRMTNINTNIRYQHIEYTNQLLSPPFFHPWFCVFTLKNPPDSPLRGDHRHQHGGIFPHFAQRRSGLGLRDAPRQRVQRRGVAPWVFHIFLETYNSPNVFGVSSYLDDHFPVVSGSLLFPRTKPGKSHFYLGFLA